MPSKPLSELESYVGEKRRTVDGLVVERGKIAEFARAIEAASPVYYDRESAVMAGYPDVPVPLTFTRTAYFPHNLVEGIKPPEFGIDLGFDAERTVHGEQTYEYDRPVVAGDVLDATTALVDVYTKGGSEGRTLTFAVLETSYTDADGVSAITERRMRIERGPADGSESPSTERDEHSENGEDSENSGNDLLGEDDNSGRSDSDVSEPLSGIPSVGTSMPTFRVPDISRRQIVRYLGASGDFNPLHYDREFACRGGHDDVVVPGMYVAGIASAALTEWVSVELIRQFRTRFVSVVYPGTDLTVTGTVTGVDEELMTTLEFAVEGMDGPIVTGEATLGR